MKERGFLFVASVVTVLIAVPALIVVPAALIALNIYRAGTPTQMGISWGMCDFVKFRRQVATAKDGTNRIQFFGFSNVMMGIRAGDAGRMLQRPTTNLGMNANLTNGVVYELLEQVLKPGDTLIVIMPYFYFGADTRIEGQFTVVRDYIFDCSPTAYRRLSFLDFLKLALAQRPGQVLEGTLRKLQDQFAIDLGRKMLPPFPMFNAGAPGAAFDENGDWTMNAERMRPADYRDRIQKTSIDAVRGFNEHGESVRTLKNFLSLASSRGIKIVAAWPTLYFENKRELAATAEKIERFYREIGVPVAGQYARYLYSIDHFFESANHLTAEASRVYTRQIVEDLRPFLEH
jgi:hypothetical protein